MGTQFRYYRFFVILDPKISGWIPAQEPPEIVEVDVQAGATNLAWNVHVQDLVQWSAGIAP